MQKIDVKSMANQILDHVASVPNKMKSLLILYAGDDPASASYMRGKIKDCNRCGIPYMQVRVHDQEDLLEMIHAGNEDDTVGGIMVQLPLPFGFNEEEAIAAIDPKKDVDGFTPNSPFSPCTPEGIVYIMHKELGEDLSGKRALIVGRGKLVGRPLYEMLQYTENMSVMQVGSSEKQLDEIVRGLEWSTWDCIVTATGKADLILLESAESKIVIDAGITRSNGHITGDCYGFSDAYKETMRVTTVPGGVGLMTRAILMLHMLRVQ